MYKSIFFTVLFTSSKMCSLQLHSTPCNDLYVTIKAYCKMNIYNIMQYYTNFLKMLRREKYVKLFSILLRYTWHIQYLFIQLKMGVYTSNFQDKQLLKVFPYWLNSLLIFTLVYCIALFINVYISYLNNIRCTHFFVKETLLQQKYCIMLCKEWNGSVGGSNT